jgi:hypothetical protein
LKGAALADAQEELERMGARRNEIEARLAQVEDQQQKDTRSVEQVVEDALAVLAHESQRLLTLSGEPLREVVNQLVTSLSVDMETKDVEMTVALPVWATAAKPKPRKRSKKSGVAVCPTTTLWSQAVDAIFGQVADVLRQAMLVVFYQTGIRLNEAANLTWQDIDFEAAKLHVTRREAEGFVQKWSPKDHELREIPLPDQALNALAALQAQAPEGCPYVFMDSDRWEYYRAAVIAKTWKPKRRLLNNVLRKFKTLCKRAGVGKFTIHDLRRSCITNWAKTQPIHVTQQYAGHSDINTTNEYYVSV